MNKAQLRSYVRTKLQDAVGMYLWSDIEIDSAVREAECEVALRNRCIFDQNSATLTFQTVVGQSSYPADPRFFRITRFYVDNKVINRSSREQIDDYHHRALSSVQGTTRRYFIDEDDSIVLDPTPARVVTVKYAGYRYPNPMIDDADNCEIPERLQIKMLEWAFKILKEKEDAETLRPVESARHEANFDKEFGPKVNANQARLQFQYSSREIKYGGY